MKCGWGGVVHKSSASCHTCVFLSYVYDCKHQSECSMQCSLASMQAWWSTQPAPEHNTGRVGLQPFKHVNMAVPLITCQPAIGQPQRIEGGPGVGERQKINISPQNCKTSSNDNINPRRSSSRARDCVGRRDWSAQVRHVGEMACLSAPQKTVFVCS